MVVERLEHRDLSRSFGLGRTPINRLGSVFEARNDSHFERGAVEVDMGRLGSGG
jgi:hypothetical protein